MTKRTIKIGKIIKRTISISLLVMLFIFMTLTILFQVNKDKIATSLLLKVNEYQNGEVAFDDLNFNPFIHFPYVSIVLYEIHYYEGKQNLPNTDTVAILSLEKLYIDFNLIDLLKGEVNVPNIHLENGRLNLLVDDNGSLNLMKALKKAKVAKAPIAKQKEKAVKPDSLKQKKPKPKKKGVDKKPKEPTPELILDLKRINLSNIDVTYIDLKEKISSQYQLQSLQASLQYLPDTIICALDTKVHLVSAYIANSYRVDSIQLGLTTRLNLDKNFKNIRIEPSQLEINKASFLAKGTVSVKGDGAIDMVIKGNDKDFGMLNLVFTNIGIDNIERGDMFFDASIQGTLFKGVPNIKGTFGINDLDIKIPSTSQKVSDLIMRVSFDSGELDQFEGARFEITKLEAKLPQGKLTGRMTFTNFLSPQLDVDFFVKSEISGFENLIKAGNLEKMTGILELKTKFKGQFNRENKVWNKQEDYSHIIFKEVSFSKTATKKIDRINGKISLQHDDLLLDSVTVVVGESELSINASASNFKLLIAKLSSTKKVISNTRGLYIPVDTTLTSYVNVEISLNAHLDELMPFLPKNSLDSMGGGIELTSNYSGQINWEENLLKGIEGQTSISFDQVALDIPRINEFRNIDGNVLLFNSVMYFNNLHIDYGKSDVLMKGNLNNLPYLFLDIDKPIEGRLSIESNVFDYPDFFSWDSFVASAFPYRIKDINLMVAPKSTTKDLLNFIQTPRLEFTISQLDAEIEDFLPPISISKGYFVLSDKEGGVNLDFDDFKIKVLDGNVKANVDIQTSRNSSNWLNVEANLGNVNLQQTFSHWGDSIPAYFDGVLDGRANVHMTFGGSSNFKFDKVDVSSTELVFKNEEDTFQLAGLSIEARAVDYQTSSGIQESLSFKSDLHIKEVKFQKLGTDSLSYEIIADNGVFTIVPTDRNFLKQKGVGLYTLKPFSKPSEFDLKYKVDHFDIADLVRNFRDDPMIDGEMKLDLHLKSSGNTQIELLKNLNGYLSLYGNNLALQGLDLDKLIERFKRSQRFTFADLGAVALMGPLGLLVSKGSNYTGMAIVDKDHVSRIYEISADYTIENGLVTFEDVAFSTELNRMAANGTIDMQKDSLNISFALLNADGCSIFSQNMTGSTIDPAMGNVNAGKIILAPITNLAKKTVGADCDVFYIGKVKQPTKKGK